MIDPTAGDDPIPRPPDPGEAVTVLGKLAGQRQQQAGTPASAEPRQLRFGPGVPDGPTVDAWRVRSAKRRRRRRRSRGAMVLSAVAAVLLVGVTAGYVWWRWHNPFLASAASVTVANPPGSACDVTVDLVGTVATNSQAGVFTYEWLRDDGLRTGVLAQSVPAGQTTASVHLYWTVSGQGAYTGTATLRVLEPAASAATASFQYDCR